MIWRMREILDSRIDMADQGFYSVIGKVGLGWNVDVGIFIVCLP